MNKLHSYCLPLLIIFSVLLMYSCTDEDKEEPESPLDKAVKIQDALYQELQNVIVGHWIGVEHFNKGQFREHGWEDISYISWDQEYVFNADGTGVDISATHRFEFTWQLEKNPDFIHESWAIRSSPEVYVIFTYINDGLPTAEKAIWLDGDNHEFLRLCYTLLGGKPSLLDSGPLGEFGIRYKKI